MKTRHFGLIALALAGLALTGCKKEEPAPPPVTPPATAPTTPPPAPSGGTTPSAPTGS
jgi:hypothetical protein